MIELIYCSRVALDLELTEIYKILKQAQSHNQAHDITGALLFNTRFFLQLLEGPEQAVDQLYQRIQADSRHHNIRLIGRAPLVNQRLMQWSMALVTPGITNQELLLKYCQTAEFDPTGLDASNARALIH
jgi:Sensors of blue-light using FAD